MDKQNESMRERLLARLPQPENLAAYREETTSLLAKHEKALLWERMASRVCYVVVFAEGIAVFFWGQKFTTTTIQSAWLLGLALFVAAVAEMRYRIYRSKVDLLKEVKQVQLQMLELQASLRKDGDR
jgi:hypothetical protein